MIKISRLADYAAMIMEVLASHPIQRLSAAQIAQKTPIAMPTVSKVLKALNEAKLVTSERGAHGGYQLGRPPAQITVADIITAIDGKPMMTLCAEEKGVCAHDRVCRLRHHWRLISMAIFNVLNGITLLELCHPQGEMPARLKGLIEIESEVKQ
jgi:FeS assembly SUF system regulator